MTLTDGGIGPAAAARANTHTLSDSIPAVHPFDSIGGGGGGGHVGSGGGGGGGGGGGHGAAPAVGGIAGGGKGWEAPLIGAGGDGDGDGDGRRREKEPDSALAGEFRDGGRARPLPSTVHASQRAFADSGDAADADAAVIRGAAVDADGGGDGDVGGGVGGADDLGVPVDSLGVKVGGDASFELVLTHELERRLVSNS